MSSQTEMKRWELRQKLKTICKHEAVDAVPCKPLDGMLYLFAIDADLCEHNNLAGKMP